MSKYVAAKAAEIPPGTSRAVTIAGRSIAIFNVDGTYRALRNHCAHQGGPLCGGVVVADIRASRPGAYEYDPTRRLVMCPWHGWEYDLVTGQSWFDPRRQRVRPYQVEVESGSELLGPGGRADGPSKGPFVAETFPISVENDYLVVEVD
jgi:3-phenylpropionate/trans-cinnamate dioxygenase ferredoxin subunit